MTIDRSSASVASEASPEQRFLAYVRSDDKAIIQSLIREYADRSYNQARRIIGRDEGTEDAVQEAYLKLVSTAKRYDGKVPFGAWLGRLVTSTAIDYRRRMRRHTNLSDMSDGGFAAMNQQTAKTDPGENPEIEAVRTALDSLPEHYRVPLTLYYFGGLNQNETAQVLGSPAATVANQLARGLERLRKKLGRAGFAVTSAGLLALFATIPTYAATPEFKASLVESRRLAAARQGSERLLQAKTAFSSQGLSIFHVGLIVVAGASIFSYLYFQPVKNVQNSPLGPVAIASADTGLVAHWDFDEGRGTVAMSRIGDGNPGSMVNKPEWAPGKFGGALNFNGIDNYVTVPSSPSINSIKGQMTVAVWVFKHGKSDEYASIVGRRTGPLYDDLWTILYTQGAEENAYYFGMWTESGEFGIAGPSSIGDLGKWTHIAGTYDGASLRFYRNGILVGSKEARGIIADETTPVVIGAADAGTYGMSEFLNAAVDDVRIYNRALSDAEIARLAR